MKLKIAQAIILLYLKYKLLCTLNYLRKQEGVAKDWNIALYECENQTFGEATFEMQKMKWLNRITKEEVRQDQRKERTSWKNLSKRRLSMIEHTLRHGGIAQGHFKGWRRKEKDKGNTPRFEYFPKLVEEIIGLVTFREMKVSMGQS